nr:type IV secretion system protein VirB10 [uncultured Pseudomonas sp.]
MSKQTNQQVELEAFDGERGMPSVNDHGPSPAKRGLFVVMMLLVVGLGSGAAYWKHKQRADRESDAQQAKAMQVSSAVPARTFTDPPAKPEATPAHATPVPAAPPPPPAVPVFRPPAGPPPLPGDASGSGRQRPDASLDKSGSGLMAVSQKGDESTDTGRWSSGAKSQSKGGGLSALLSSTSTPSRKAEHLGNRNFILTKGSFIDCALQTRLDSTVPGMTACVVTRNIYSDNGKILLVERGSTITGEYQSNMRQGMARIFVLWSRIKTPNGVVINLDSPGTDPLGGAGLPGHIDNHFWQRFSGALMLSLVDDVARYATQETSNNSGQINFSNTSEATQNMAAEALKNTINIPPTLYKNQGEQVGVYIARDLDFSSVYDVEATNQ